MTFLGWVTCAPSSHLKMGTIILLTIQGCYIRQLSEYLAPNPKYSLYIKRVVKILGNLHEISWFIKHIFHVIGFSSQLSKEDIFIPFDPLRRVSCSIRGFPHVSALISEDLSRAFSGQLLLLLFYSASLSAWSLLVPIFFCHWTLLAPNLNLLDLESAWLLCTSFSYYANWKLLRQ